jgi:hypothetical protein
MPASELLYSLDVIDRLPPTGGSRLVHVLSEAWLLLFAAVRSSVHRSDIHPCGWWSQTLMPPLIGSPIPHAGSPDPRIYAP